MGASGRVFPASAQPPLPPSQIALKGSPDTYFGLATTIVGNNFNPSNNIHQRKIKQ
jgi:hypothetical protein